MTTAPETAALRPFLPTRDLAASRDFYVALGFTLVLDSDVAILKIGHTSIILHPPIAEGATDNLMLQLMVDDLDAWWARIAAADLPARFGVPAPKPPETQPWGLRVAYVVDPAGVLWHVAQRRPGKPHDW